VTGGIIEREDRMATKGTNPTQACTPPKPASKLANLKKRAVFVGDPDDIFHIDWLKEWREEWGIPEPHDSSAD
jgi:hypothetical protein